MFFPGKEAETGDWEVINNLGTDHAKKISHREAGYTGS
jgi:hypothetical protein